MCEFHTFSMSDILCDECVQKVNFGLDVSPRGFINVERVLP